MIPGVGFWRGAGVPSGPGPRSKRFVECGCCGAYHRDDFYGDCREDSERYWDVPEDATDVYTLEEQMRDEGEI